MKFNITLLAEKEFKTFLIRNPAKTGFVSTPAGTIKFEYTYAGIHEAKFINNINIAHNSEIPDTLVLHGTDFQVKVWLATLKIPAGNTVSYTDIATTLGNPKGVRAVARALATNKIPYFIPCHRIIKKNGNLCGYNGGVNIKEKLLEMEKRA